MKLQDAVSQYATFRKSLGERFSVNGLMLNGFCRAVGVDAQLAEVTSEQVAAYLAGRGPLTSTYHIKYNALRGFYRYAVSRGLVTESPLPRVIPKQPPCMTPYIYSMAELRRLVSAAGTYQRNRSIVPPSMMRTMILMLYGAALRVSEARALKLNDVDLSASIITIRESKFFKSRLVPIGRKLTQVMREFMLWRAEAGLSQEKESLFFLARNGRPVHLNTIHHAFRRIRDAAEVQRPPDSRWQPRLHDLRQRADSPIMPTSPPGPL